MLHSVQLYCSLTPRKWCFAPCNKTLHHKPFGLHTEPSMRPSSKKYSHKCEIFLRPKQGQGQVVCAAIGGQVFCRPTLFFVPHPSVRLTSPSTHNIYISRYSSSCFWSSLQLGPGPHIEEPILTHASKGTQHVQRQVGRFRGTKSANQGPRIGSRGLFVIKRLLNNTPAYRRYDRDIQ